MDPKITTFRLIVEIFSPEDPGHNFFRYGEEFLLPNLNFAKCTRILEQLQNVLLQAQK